MMNEIRLGRALPALAAEIEELLRDEGKDDLASQGGHLSLVDRCRFGDDFCATLYAVLRLRAPGDHGTSPYRSPLEPAT